MKASLIAVLFLAFLVAVIYSCNPDGNGKPESCAGVRGVVNYRNNWDPTHYFQCNGSSEVLIKSCNQTGFMANVSSCVPWPQWSWTPVCP